MKSSGVSTGCRNGMSKKPTCVYTSKRRTRVYTCLLRNEQGRGMCLRHAGFNAGKLKWAICNCAYVLLYSTKEYLGYCTRKPPSLRLHSAQATLEARKVPYKGTLGTVLHAPLNSPSPRKQSQFLYSIIENTSHIFARAIISPTFQGERK